MLIRQKYRKSSAQLTATRRSQIYRPVNMPNGFYSQIVGKLSA